MRLVLCDLPQSAAKFPCVFKENAVYHGIRTGKIVHIIIFHTFSALKYIIVGFAVKMQQSDQNLRRNGAYVLFFGNGHVDKFQRGRYLFTVFY